MPPTHPLRALNLCSEPLSAEDLADPAGEMTLCSGISRRCGGHSVTGLNDGRLASYAAMSSSWLSEIPMSSRPSSNRQRV
jgi:hypothetical protein